MVMKKHILGLLLSAATFVGVANAAGPGPVPGSGCPTSGCTFSGLIGITAAGGLSSTGGIVSNVSTYAYPASGNPRARYWASILDTTGSPNGLYESSFFFTNLTTPGALSSPLINAALTGGSVTNPLTIATAGSGLTNGTYNLIFTGGGCSSAAGTATVSGGSITATNLTNAGSGCTSVPTVNIAIGNVSKEMNIVHAYGQLDAGVSSTGLIDPGEVSFLNNGNLSGTFIDWNALFHNGANGAVGAIQGLHCQVENDNPNAGSVGSNSCVYVAPLSAQTPTGASGSVTATQSGGTVTLAIANAGSGYQNGTFNLYITGGACGREPTGTFTVSGGQITSTNLTFAGSNCTANPTVALFFGAFPTFNYSAQIQDPFSTFAMKGNMVITDSGGNLTPPALNNLLTINASSAAGNEFLINGLCGVTGGTCFSFTAAGSATLYGQLTTGSSGKNNGAIVFTNAGTSSANITLSPPTGGVTLTAATITIPDVTGTLAEVITATSTSIGGGALAAGACASTTVTVTNATTSMAVAASPVTYPGDGTFWFAYVSSAGTATVKVCESVAGTPTASVYNVRVVM